MLLAEPGCLWISAIEPNTHTDSTACYLTVHLRLCLWDHKLPSEILLIHDAYATLECQYSTVAWSGCVSACRQRPRLKSYSQTLPQ